MVFDYQSAIKPLVDRSVESVTLRQLPDFNIQFKELVISGEIQGVGFRKWVRGRAVKKNLVGRTVNLNDGNVRIRVGGLSADIENLVREIQNSDFRTGNIDVSDYEGILYNSYTDDRTKEKKIERKITNLERSLRKNKAEAERMNEENKQLTIS